MSKMVDSNQKKLNISEIILIALENTKSKYPPKVAYPAIVTEMSQKNTDVKQIGNTIFVLHRADKDQAAFKALNADIASNFVENSKKYVVYAKKELGLKILVTEFQGSEINTLFHVISKKPPMPNMGFQEYKVSPSVNRIVLNLG
jgi:hypothetical protein